MQGELKGDRVVMGKDAIEELYNNLYYGRLKDETLELALVEAAYLSASQGRSVAPEEVERSPAKAAQ